MKTITIPARIFSHDSCKRKIKKLNVFWLILSLFLTFGFIQNSYGQIVSEGAAIKANFGIDADVYANVQDYGQTTVIPNIDDWFKNGTWTGNGENVIRQDSVDYFRNNILANNNYSFVRRMSVPRNTMVNGYLWIDAVYARDNNSTQGNNDATVFTATQDKNGDNPTTWVLGVKGSPIKNDIVDVFGHMRQDSNGDIWGFGGTTTISSDGDSHTDFEFFANKVTLNLAGTAFENTGTDGGHRSWKFDADGNLIEVGDLLVAVDFKNGGTVPVTGVRVWISGADRANFNNRPNRPFDLTGEFDGGVNSGIYGYAGITAKDNAPAPAVFAAVNVLNPTLGAPWGSLEGSQAKFYDDIQKLQFTEFGINLTALGLEGIGGDACNKVLGTLLVKTRSSASFTAELKDYAGPFLFGYELNVGVDVQDLASCEVGNTGSAIFNLNDGVTDDHGGLITFHSTEADANNDVNPLAPANYSVSIAASPKTIWVRSENISEPECFAVGSFMITVYDNPTPVAQNLSDCEIGNTGAATFDLNDGVTTADGTVSFYASQADADAATNALTAVGYSVSIANSPKTIYVRSDNANDGEEGCYGTTSFTITVYDNPAPVADNLADCEIGNTGAATFDLNDGVTTADGTVSFYASQADADAATNALTAVGYSVSIANSPKTIYVRSDNANDGEEGCYGTTSFTITVYDNPTPVADNLADCEIGNTGAATFDLNDGVTTADGTVSFYASQADADAATNALTAVGYSVSIADSPKTIYVRSDNANDGEEGCYGTTSFTITVYDNPTPEAQNLSDCEIGNTGAATFNLNDGVTTPDGTVSFYASQADADAATNALTAVGYSVSIANSPKTIYVRSDNANDGEEGCYGTTSFTITVYDNPTPVADNLADCEIGNTGAATFDLNDGVTTADGTVSFYASQADADAATNALTAVGYSVSIADSPKTIYVRSDNANDGEEGCYGTTSFTITVNPNPILVINDPETVCDGVTVDITLATVTSGSTLYGATLSYWTNSGATTPLANPNAVGAGTYYIKAETTAGCKDIEAVVVTTEPCIEVLCTYTQGYYGNAGGMACTPDGTLGTLALIQRSINNMGGTLYIGRGSNAGADGGSFTLPYDFAQKIIDIMPGGGSASVLTTDYDQNSLPPLKNGKISNGLLSQTIALALNLYMPPNDLSKSVGDFVLEGGKYLVTNKRAKTSMCSDPVAADCYDEPDAIKNWWIPANVVNALPAPKNVWSLFQLANDALGGATLPVGVKLSDINSAVDAINNAFDGCRFFLRYSAVKESCPIIELTIAAKVAVVEEPVVIDSSVDFKVYPVPFEDVINVSYRFEYGTDVTIQVFNLQGGLMYGVVDNMYNNGEVAVKQISLPRTFDQALIIRLTTNKEKLSKTIVAKSSTQR